MQIFENERENLFKNVIFNNEGFRNFSLYDKAIWLLLQEDISSLRIFAQYVDTCFYLKAEIYNITSNVFKSVHLITAK